ncbi:41415_t:CDS:2 [Gigaspora margarita]|uniref:41415_t:CDS:1 n=1 Tax=Gigaspora margarita TaxID=4874 RepID=A0ABN7UN92_GIGMA|nr:41415_t:CDS:2 [Gigaspora margarita]
MSSEFTSTRKNNPRKRDTSRKNLENLINEQKLTKQMKESIT